MWWSWSMSFENMTRTILSSVKCWWTPRCKNLSWDNTACSSRWCWGVSMTKWPCKRRMLYSKKSWWRVKLMRSTPNGVMHSSNRSRWGPRSINSTGKCLSVSKSKCRPSQMNRAILARWLSSRCLSRRSIIKSNPSQVRKLFSLKI